MNLLPKNPDDEPLQETMDKIASRRDEQLKQGIIPNPPPIENVLWDLVDNLSYYAQARKNSGEHDECLISTALFEVADSIYEILIKHYGPRDTKL